MNTLAILQATAAILMGLQGKPTAAPVDVQRQLIQTAEQSIQLATQAVVQQTQPYAMRKNTGVWPTALEVVSSPYLNIDGGYTLQGDTVKVDQGTFTFGDLNGDGKDDAAVVVYRVGSNNQRETSLAVLLNQNDTMFNIADIRLAAGTGQLTTTVHKISDGKIFLNSGKYELFGNKIYAN